jgi:hypothetical protein
MERCLAVRPLAPEGPLRSYPTRSSTRKTAEELDPAGDVAFDREDTHAEGANYRSLGRTALGGLDELSWVFGVGVRPCARPHDLAALQDALVYIVKYYLWLVVSLREGALTVCGVE